MMKSERLQTQQVIAGTYESNKVEQKKTPQWQNGIMPTKKKRETRDVLIFAVRPHHKLTELCVRGFGGVFLMD